MKLRHLILVGALPLLGACVVEEPNSGRYPRQTTIEYNQRYDDHYRDDRYRTNWDHNRDGWDDDYDHHPSRFCPPGQAKKGRC